MDKVLDFVYESNIVEQKIKNIKLYNKMFDVINDHHIKNFVVYANDYNMSGVKLSIFYKISETNIMYIESFFLDCNYPLKYLLNWQNYDHKNFDNYNNLNDMHFKLCYKMILNEHGILNLELFKGNILELNNNVLEITKKHTDGYHINNNDFNFQIILWELLNQNYNKVTDNILRCNKFKNINLGLDYKLNSFYDDSIYLRYMIKKQGIYCDKCKKEIHHFRDKKHVNEHWEYKGITHLWTKCYNKKKDKEDSRKGYIKRLILLQGKRIIFKRRLEEVKKLNFEFQKVNDINFYKKMIKGLVCDINCNNQKKICTICYDHFLDKKIAAGNCGHCFHLYCVKSLTSCPICREPNPNFRELYF